MTAAVTLLRYNNYQVWSLEKKEEIPRLTIPLKYCSNKSIGFLLLEIHAFASSYYKYVGVLYREERCQRIGKRPKPKEGQDFTLRNYRLILLLNNDYKLFIIILPDKLKISLQ